MLLHLRRRRGKPVNSDMGQFIDLTGKEYGNWRVLCKSDDTGNGIKPRIYWTCECMLCGSTRNIDGKSLRGGVSKHCDCTRYEHMKISPPKRTHGKSHTRLYYVWCGMRQRCSDPHNIHYRLYGGRGISVCDEWKNNFQAFYDWAMNAGYDPYAPRGACTIDRINNDGNYTPDNCRWVDASTQAGNRRISIRKAGTF